MSGLNVALLDEGTRNKDAMLPALQKLLQLAYSDDINEQLEAVMGISKLIQRGPVSASSFGPLCHTLSRLAASEGRAVVAYSTRGIKLLLTDDALRPQATVAGIPSVLGAALREWEDDAPCLREILGALQTLCYDKSTVLAVVNAGAVGPVLELLGSTDLELRILSTAVAANILSFSDSLLLTNEACIESFSDYMPDLLDAAKSGDGVVREYGLAALANACAHPVLAGRAKELGAVAQMRLFLESNTALRSIIEDRPHVRARNARRVQRAETALARLTDTGRGGGSSGGGDIEQGGGSGTTAKLIFYSGKWGAKPSVSFFMSMNDRVRAVLVCCCWLGCIHLLSRPLMAP